MLATALLAHSPAEAAVVAQLTSAVDALRAGRRAPASPATVRMCRMLARRTGDDTLSELIGAHGYLAGRVSA